MQVSFQSYFGALSAGAQGQSVRELQDSLAQVGFAPQGGTDGVYGANTSTSVKAFQASAGLDVTGTADDGTLAALAAKTGNQISSTNLSTSGKASGGTAPTMVLPGLDITAQIPQQSIADKVTAAVSGMSTGEKVGLGLLGVAGLALLAGAFSK